MACRLRGHGGGIAGLCELIRQHKEAVEYHLITLGLRLAWLGTSALSWRDLLVIVKQCPRDSGLYHAVSGPDANWGLIEHLLADVFDALQIANWQRIGDPQLPRPKPLPRPGVEPPEDETHFGDASVDIDVMAAWLAKRNPLQAQPTREVEHV